MTKSKHVKAERGHTSSRHVKTYSSDSDTCSDSISNHSSVTYYSSESDDYYSSSGDSIASDCHSASSIISPVNKKKNKMHYRLKRTKSKRGMLRISKKGAILNFVDMTKIVLKKWDTGGYIDDTFLAGFVEAYTNVLKKKVDTQATDALVECQCSVKSATYVLCLAFFMHYSATCDDPERWKVRLNALFKHLINHRLLWKTTLDCVIKTDPSGNFYKDVSGVLLIRPSMQQDVFVEIPVDSGFGTTIELDVNADIITDPIADPTKPPYVYDLRDIARVILLEKRLTGYMTSASKRLMSFIDTNVYNDD